MKGSDKQPIIGIQEGRRLFGQDPAAYAAGRPPYPSAVYDVLVERCGLSEPTPTLEIGAGAGQATAKLLEHGASPLTIVEPNRRFAAYLREQFAGRAKVIATTFERASVPQASFNLAASAAAFHWVEQTTGLSKVSSALRAGGWWAAWWTAHHDPDALDEFHDRLEPIFSKLPAPAPKAGATLPNAFNREAHLAGLESFGAFDAIELHEFREPVTLDVERTRALFATFSPLLALEDDHRRRVLAEIETIVEEDFGGRVEQTSLTVLYIARRALSA